MALYLDTETPPIARGRLAQQPICVQWALGGDTVQVDLWKAWTPALDASEIVGANIAYDLACICVGTPELIPEVFKAYDEGRVRDILLDGKLLDIAAGEYEHRQTKGWSLAELARRAGLRIDKDDDDETGNGSWRLRFQELATVPVAHWPEGARVYAALDVEATRTVHLWQQARRAEWQRTYGLDPLAPGHSAHAAASAFALHLMSCQGICTDRATVERVSARLEAHLGRIGKRLQRATLVRSNGTRDTKRAQVYMERVCARAKREVERTPTGQPKIDRDQAILSGSRVLEMYAEYSGASLLRGRLERLKQGYELPLQTRFDPLKETGRTSSTQPGAPLVGEQLQNFPRAAGVTPAERKRERGYVDKHGVQHAPEWFEGIRECFMPPPGFTFIVVDYPSAELYSFAQLCKKLFGFSDTGDLLLAGKDLHIHFAMASLDRAYESFNKKADKFHRDRAKPAQYGFRGGMGPDKFILYSRKQYNVNFTRPEAVETKARWTATYADAKEYLQWIGRQLGDRDTFTYVHPVTGFVRGGCYYSSGANHGFQHLTAYGAKAAAYQVTRACFTPSSDMWGCRPWNFPHDEIVTVAPLESAAEAAEEQARIMEEAFNAYHPDYPLKCEPVLTSVWSKSAEAVRVNGRLVPWAPPEVAA